MYTNRTQKIYVQHILKKLTRARARVHQVKTTIIHDTHQMK